MRNTFAFKYKKFPDRLDRDRFDQFMSNEFILNLVDKRKRYRADDKNGGDQSRFYKHYKDQISEKREIREVYKQNYN